MGLTIICFSSHRVKDEILNPFETIDALGSRFLELCCDLAKVCRSISGLELDIRFYNFFLNFRFYEDPAMRDEPVLRRSTAWRS
jgi:hypothetical protein